MKRILALLLLLSFAAQSFSQGVVLLNFYINRAYIAANKCENRYRPMLHCNGNCILAKRMKQQEQNEKKNPELKMQAKYEVVSSRSFFTAQLLPALFLVVKYYSLKIASLTDRAYDIFHPPCW